MSRRIQLDVVTLSSNVIPSCTIQNNCGNFSLIWIAVLRRQVDA